VVMRPRRANDCESSPSSANPNDAGADERKSHESVWSTIAFTAGSGRIDARRPLPLSTWIGSSRCGLLTVRGRGAASPHPTQCIIRGRWRGAICRRDRAVACRQNLQIEVEE